MNIEEINKHQIRKGNCKELILEFIKKNSSKKFPGFTVNEIAFGMNYRKSSLHASLTELLKDGILNRIEFIGHNFPNIYGLPKYLASSGIKTTGGRNESKRNKKA